MTSQAPAGPAEARTAAPANLVLAVLELVKVCQLYDGANQAAQQRLEPTREAICSFCVLRESDVARILFAGDVVFVNRRVLKASRDMVLLARELGTMLARCELTEVTFERNVAANEVMTFARCLADGQRDRFAAAKLRDAKLQGIQLRNIELSAEDWLPEFKRSLFARVVRAYAASTLFMRRFYADLQGGQPHMGNRVKRVAQKLVAIGEDAPQLAVTLAASRFPDAEPRLCARHMQDVGEHGALRFVCCTMPPAAFHPNPRTSISAVPSGANDPGPSSACSAPWTRCAPGKRWERREVIGSNPQHHVTVKDS